MIAVRIFSSLGHPLMSVEHHTGCCGNGTCEQPPVVGYVHPTRYLDDIPTTAGLLAEMFHQYVSECPEFVLMEALHYTPVRG